RVGDTHLLHSFPTRRSSDLDFPEGEARDAEGSELQEWLGHDRLCRLKGSAIRTRELTARCHHTSGRPSRKNPPVGPPSGRVAAQDRKSTRLNSSHGSISYAV